MFLIFKKINSIFLGIYYKLKRKFLGKKNITAGDLQYLSYKEIKKDYPEIIETTNQIVDVFQKLKTKFERSIPLPENPKTLADYMPFLRDFFYFTQGMTPYELNELETSDILKLIKQYKKDVESGKKYREYGKAAKQKTSAQYENMQKYINELLKDKPHQSNGEIYRRVARKFKLKRETIKKYKTIGKLKNRANNIDK